MRDPTPEVTRVTVPRHGSLYLGYADDGDTRGEVDVLGQMKGPVFDQARTKVGFAEVYVDPDTGTVAWPNGAALDADALHTRLRTGRWPGEGPWPDHKPPHRFDR